MAFTLTIETDNAAFEGDDLGDEVARILKIVAGKISSGQESGSCFDSNGNRCGEFELETSEEDDGDEADEEQDDDGEPRCADSRGHKWAISDEDENVCYCERCGCSEY